MKLPNTELNDQCNRYSLRSFLLYIWIGAQGTLSSLADGTALVKCEVRCSVEMVIDGVYVKKQPSTEIAYLGCSLRSDIQTRIFFFLGQSVVLFFQSRRCPKTKAAISRDDRSQRSPSGFDRPILLIAGLSLKPRQFLDPLQNAKSFFFSASFLRRQKKLFQFFSISGFFLFFFALVLFGFFSCFYLFLLSSS